MPIVPHPAASNQPDIHAHNVVLGVDTHKHVHVAPVLTALGVVLGSATCPTTAAPSIAAVHSDRGS